MNLPSLYARSLGDAAIWYLALRDSFVAEAPRYDKREVRQWFGGAQRRVRLVMTAERSLLIRGTERQVALASKYAVALLTAMTAL